MGNNSDKKMLFEAMHKVTGMPLNEYDDIAAGPPNPSYNQEKKLELNGALTNMMIEYAKYSASFQDFKQDIGEIMYHIQQDNIVPNEPTDREY